MNDWWVYSTAVENGVILVECRNTGTRGAIHDPSPEEWRKAFHAPSAPYRWEHPERVMEAIVV